MVFPNGDDAQDSSQEGQGGFRIDSEVSDQNQMTVQGDYLYNVFDLFRAGTAINRSGNVLGRWTHTFDADSELQLQSYYDHFQRDVPGQFGETRNTYDADLHCLGFLPARA